MDEVRMLMTVDHEDLQTIAEYVVQTEKTRDEARNLLENVQTLMVDYWINVKQYGAVGDGVTDDTIAIQAALDNDVPNIFFPKTANGYRTGALKINKQHNIDLNGNMLKAIDGINGDMLSIYAPNVTIKNGIIDGNKAKATNARHIISLYADNPVLTKLLLRDAQRDAIWSAADNTFGYADNAVLNQLTIENPGRHGILLNSVETNYRQRLTIEHCELSKDSYNGVGLVLGNINNLNITDVLFTDGFRNDLLLTRIGKASINNVKFYRLAADSNQNDFFDTTYIDDMLVVTDCIFKSVAGDRTCALNVSTETKNVIISGCKFFNLGYGIIGHENPGDALIQGCQFYNLDQGVVYNNSFQVTVSKCLFFGCNKPMSFGAGGEASYDKLSLRISDNTVRETGNEAVAIALNSNSIGDFSDVVIDNNEFYDIHSPTNDQIVIGNWVNYLAVNGNVSILKISGLSSTNIAKVTIQNNVFKQSLPYSQNSPNGGAAFVYYIDYVDQLLLKNNIFHKNFLRINANSSNILNIVGETYFDSGLIDLSGAPYSQVSFPSRNSDSCYLGALIVYTEATSAEAGIDILIRDGITKTIKATITTQPNQVAGTSRFIYMPNLGIAAGRTIEIYSPGGKVGTGKCYLRVYYLETI